MQSIHTQRLPLNSVHNVPSGERNDIALDYSSKKALTDSVVQSIDHIMLNKAVYRGEDGVDAEDFFTIQGQVLRGSVNPNGNKRYIGSVTNSLPKKSFSFGTPRTGKEDDAIAACWKYVTDYNVDHKYFVKMVVVLDDLTRLTIRHPELTKYKDYQLEISTDHVWEDVVKVVEEPVVVPPEEFNPVLNNGFIDYTKNSIHNQIDTTKVDQLEFVVVNEIDLTIKDKLQAISSRVEGCITEGQEKYADTRFRLQIHQLKYNQTFNFKKCGGRYQAEKAAHDVRLQMNVAHMLFKNYVLVLDNQTLLVTIDSTAKNMVGRHYLLLDTKHKHLVDDFTNDINLCNKYASTLFNGDKHYFHTYIFALENPGFVSNLQDNMVDHNNQNKLDCRVANLKRSDTTDNNGNQKSRNRTLLEYYDKPLTGIDLLNPADRPTHRWAIDCKYNKVRVDGYRHKECFNPNDPTERRRVLQDIVALRVKFMKEYKVCSGILDLFDNITQKNMDSFSHEQLVDAIMDRYDRATAQVAAAAPTALEVAAAAN